MKILGLTLSSCYSVSPMGTIVDTHFHLYPCFDIIRAFLTLSSNLTRLSGETGPSESTVRAAIVIDRDDTNTYERIADGSLPLPDRWARSLDSVPGAIRIDDAEARPLFFFPGRQILTAERIEILALLTTRSIPGGAPSVETVTNVSEAGGIPLIPWSAGRWIGDRGRLIRSLLERRADSGLILGDTSLRPSFFPRPAIMRAAEQNGTTVLAGSDPLPVPGEELCGGSYASYFSDTLSPDDPSTSIRKILSDTNGPFRSIGRRSNPIRTLGRLLAHERSERALRAP